MRKTKLLFLLLLLMAIPAAVQAYTNNEIVRKGGLIYQVIDLANFKVSLVGTESSVSGEVNVPATFDDGKGTTFYVTRMGGNENYSCGSGVTKINLPEGVTEIYGGALGGASFAEMTIPSTVSTITHTAFYRFSSLPKFTVASGNANFSSDADGCLYSKNMEDLYAVPTGVNTTGGTYTVNSNVKNIFKCAFTNAQGVKKIVLPANLQSVETGYPSIIPNSSELEEFELASGGSTPYKVIEGVLFKDNTLSNYPPAKPTADYKVPDGITSIAERGIEGSRYMKTIDLNDVVELSKNALYTCHQLKTVTLPAHLKVDGVAGGISNCYNLSEYKTPSDCENFEAIDGVVYSKGDHSILYFFPPAKAVTDGKYTVANWVKTIEKNALLGTTTIKELTIPANVEAINDDAFGNMKNLSKVSYVEPSNVQTIGTGAFGQCPALVEATLPSSLTELKAIYSLSKNLETINVPDGSKLTTISANALQSNTKLKNFNFLGDCDLTTIKSGAFQNLSQLREFHFPKGVTSIENNAFNGCTAMTTAKFADDAVISTIGAGAFADCGLTSIDIPNSVTKLEREAFRNCAALTVVNVSENLTDISSEAFKYCENLVDINVDKKNTKYSSVDGYLLSKDKKTLVLFPHGKAHDKFTLLPPSITKIGDYAFYECENLTSVMIPNKVTSIGDRAFSLCKKLKDIAFLCDAPIDPNNIDQRPNHKSFDDGTAGTTNMPANINIYVRKDIKDQYDAISFYKDKFKSIQPSFVENGNEYLQVAASVADLLSVKSENHTFVVPEKTQTGLDVALIGDYAFQTASDKIKEVVIKNHIEYVGAKAFMTNIANNSSTIENVFFISNAPSKKMLSTTRFELDETGNNYKEFASTTNIYVKKSVVEKYKSKWKKQMWDTSTGAMKDSPDDYQFYNQIDYKIKSTPALTNKLYSTFSREFDVDFGDIDESGNRLFWDAAENCPKVIAFTSGEKIGNSIIRMQSINLGDDIAKDGLYVPANTGVVLKAIDGSLPNDFYYRIGEDDVWSYDGENILKPVTVDAKDIVATDDGNTNFYISGGKAFRVSQAQQFKNEGKLTIGVHKAYININVPAGAKLSLLFDDGETTGIESINATDATTSEGDDAYYNLNGQRVSKPAKGVYIHNGKKVIVK